MAGRSDGKILKIKGGRSPQCCSFGIWSCTVGECFLLRPCHREEPGGIWVSIVCRSGCSWQRSNAAWLSTKFLMFPGAFCFISQPTFDYCTNTLTDILVLWILWLPCEWMFQKCSFGLLLLLLLKLLFCIYSVSWYPIQENGAGSLTDPAELRQKMADFTLFSFYSFIYYIPTTVSFLFPFLSLSPTPYLDSPSDPLPFHILSENSRSPWPINQIQHNKL